MQILNEETGTGKAGSTFILIMNKREVHTLIDMAEAACKANTRRSSFRRWSEKFNKCFMAF